MSDEEFDGEAAKLSFTGDDTLLFVFLNPGEEPTDVFDIVSKHSLVGGWSSDQTHLVFHGDYEDMEAAETELENHASIPIHLQRIDRWPVR